MGKAANETYAYTMNEALGPHNKVAGGISGDHY